MPAVTERMSAFCLHVRPYRDTSAIAELLTAERGRISVVAQGIKTPGRRNHHAALLQPFVPIAVIATGRTELKTIRQLEAEAPPLRLQGAALFAGLYLNELLIRLLQGQAEAAELFANYHQTLQQLQAAAVAGSLETPLRQFEFALLDQLGYGVPFIEVDPEGRHERALQSEARYRFMPEAGFVRITATERVDDELSGAALCALRDGVYATAETRLTAKLLMRRVLLPLLGHEPLRSRMLFM